MSIRVLRAEPFILNLRARMPFRYGITSMTALPHCFLRAEVEVNGRPVVGISADHLPPKWFTKDPNSSFRQDVAVMLAVIDSACAVAASTGRHKTVFDWWMHAYQGQAAWGGGWGHPPLLSNFGTSLVERAVIDAFCGAEGTTFGESVRRDDFGVKLGAVHAELEGSEPSDWLPEKPLRSAASRHTIGLADYLTEAEIPAAERVTDGLPQSFEACIREYGLTYFKIKIGGDVEQALERISRIADVIRREVKRDFAFTLDANENFKTVDALRALWDRLSGEPSLQPFLTRLLLIEQPLHRDVALGPAVAEGFRRWPGRPPIIIDESDGKLTTAREALDMGYGGASHKNCKGVFKGLMNACLIARRNRESPDRRIILSSEDLTNVGISVLQDLAVAMTLGIPQVERNGHHYFKGLSMLPDDVQEAMLAGHPDVFRRHPGGYVTFRIEEGRVSAGSVVDHGFGRNFEFDASRFTSARDWSFDDLRVG